MNADILACLPATVAELVRQTGEDYETILSVLRRMKALRLVTTSNNGRSVIWKEA